MIRKSLKITNPLVLAATIILVAVSCMLVLKLATHNGLMPWRIIGMAMLFYAAASQMSGLFVKRWFQYAAISLLCFVLIIAILFPIANWISDVPLHELFYMKTVYVLVGVFYILLNGLAGVFRVIHDMVKTEEDR